MTNQEAVSKLSPEIPIKFCTLGMTIIDEIHFPPPRPPMTDVVGGAGIYAALGARIVTPTSESKTVGLLVDAGSDFPSHLRETIASWGMSSSTRDTPWRQTTRCKITYDEHGNQQGQAKSTCGVSSLCVDTTTGFEYTEPRLRLDQDSLHSNLLKSKSFHLICASSRCVELTQGICERRRRLNEDLEPPWFVWEPLPWECVPEGLDDCQRALNSVDVVSPNHVELCSFYGVEAHDENGDFKKENIEECCNKLLRGTVLDERKCSALIRAGKAGCFITTGPESKGIWLPAYHEDQKKVVDPTGGGNGFLGGFTVTSAIKRRGESNLGRLRRAAIEGAVAASFMIEQVGVPALSLAMEGKQLVNGDTVVVGDTLVNGESVIERSREYVGRIC